MRPEDWPRRRCEETVSIHAPAWGATCHVDLFAGFFACFNPRTRVGCDDQDVPKGLMHGQFQSTHPRGVRHTAGPLLIRPALFQSTHPRGVRRLEEDIAGTFAWFQSTHPRGVRHNRRLGSQSVTVFQSTHPRGVRPIGNVITNPPKLVSIHAPAWGATSCRKSSIARKSCFNPRTRVGCDFTELVNVHGAQSFNPRTRVGCDPLVTPVMHPCHVFQSTHPRGVRLGQK